MQSKDTVINILKTTKGQIDAVIKMLEDEKQCFDVLTQILAIQGLIKKANVLIVENHLNRCIKEELKHENSEEKIDEVMKLITRFIKN